MFVKDLKGLKYPDSELIRWFFKNKLCEIQDKKVLEFGCSNGNNLSLFANYDYECLGVDLDSQNIENANYNFKEIMGYTKCEFFCENITEFARKRKDVRSDVFLIPNVINFLSKEEFVDLLEDSRKNHLYKWGGGFRFFLLKGKKHQRSSLWIG